MYTLDFGTNGSPLDRILRTMTAEVQMHQDWQSKLRYRRLYMPTKAVATVKKVRVTKKVAWERILLPLLLAACFSAYQANSGLDREYKSDLQTTYQHLINR